MRYDRLQCIWNDLESFEMILNLITNKHCVFGTSRTGAHRPARLTLDRTRRDIPLRAQACRIPFCRVQDQAGCATNTGLIAFDIIPSIFIVISWDLPDCL